MNIKEYINRINYKGDLKPDLSVLNALQAHHIFAVPFENLDIHYGKPIVLDIDKFYQKIVIEKRGGFCYELNGLFHHLLKEVGFNSKMISARVYDHKKRQFGEEFDHLAIIVELDQTKYLVDVGFGEFAAHPLIIQSNVVQEDQRGQFSIEKENDIYTVFKIKGDSKNIEYKFTDKDRTLNEFQGMCQYHQTSPDSHFTQRKLITRPTPGGRITLTGNRLKITENDAIQKNIGLSETQYFEQLHKLFSIAESQLILVDKHKTNHH